MHYILIICFCKLFQAFFLKICNHTYLFSIFSNLILCLTYAIGCAYDRAKKLLGCEASIPLLSLRNDAE
ncbi:hypothetical protein RV07_GL003629 [Enterococcus malodoratus]|nr:hypothetical protein RV07_GL003629 [Enterococcus malodoratus]